MKRIAQISAVVVVCGLLGLLVWDMVNSEGGHLVVGDRAPDWTLNRVDNNAELSLAKYKGKVVVLNFWASDCIPCVAEAKALAAAERRYAADGVQFVGMDEIDLHSFAVAFMKRHEMTWPSVADNGEVAGRYGVFQTPETFFITRNGLIAAHVPNQVTPQDLNAGIKAALKE